MTSKDKTSISPLRDYFFDNAKFILIFLVVLGHSIETVASEDLVVSRVYLLIYLIHMPAFIFIAGYFSKSYQDKIPWPKLWRATLLPLAIFQFLYALFIYLVRYDGSVSLIRPYWILWFMLSLFFWRMSLPFVRKLKHPIIAAFIVSVLAGYVNFIGYELSMSRTIYFFPFFLIGSYAERIKVSKLLVAIKPAIPIIIIVGMVIFFSSIGAFDYQWLYGSYSYEALGNRSFFAGFLRLAIYLLSGMAMVVFFCLVPDKETVYSRLGQNTLDIFLWHGFFILALRQWGILDRLDRGLVLPVAMSLSIIIIFVICYGRHLLSLRKA